MVVVCQQPSYFPWLGYFEQIARADRFVFLDSVQWIRQGRQHRTQVGIPPRWLTVPVHAHGHREKSFKDMEIDGSRPWARKHWETVKSLYGKEPYFRTQLEPLLRPFFERAQREKFLLDVCQESLYLFWDAFGLSAELHWSSEIPESGVSTERLVSICRHLEADEYYSALGSTRYLDLSLFRAAGIRVRWQHFRGGERPLSLSVLDSVAREPFSSLQARLQLTRRNALFAESLGTIPP